jgi:glycosyltransferase involved in cell wall biosynthesis
VTVIPTSVDLKNFFFQSRNPKVPYTFGYVGALGTWYLLDEMLVFFKSILERKHVATFLIVNRNEHSLILDGVRRANIDPSYIEVVSAEHHRVPSLVGRMHSAAALIRPSYSKVASAPTKVGEYLASGIPCLGNAGVGDVHEVLEGNRVGVSVFDFSQSTLAAAADRLLTLGEDPGLTYRCRSTAERFFSLSSACEKYATIYSDISRGPSEK